MSKPAKFSIKAKARTAKPPQPTGDTTIPTSPDIPVDVAVEEEAKLQEEAKKQQKREYNKRKARKQRASRKELEIVEDDDIVTSDLSQHVSLIKSTNKLSRIKRQKHLQSLVQDHEREVLLTNQDKETISKPKKTQSTPSTKKDKGKRLQSELERALALVNEVADEQEGIVVQKIVREKAKLQYIEEREQQKRERKEKKEQLKKMMIQHLRTQKKEEKRQTKEIKEEPK